MLFPFLSSVFLMFSPNGIFNYKDALATSKVLGTSDEEYEPSTDPTLLETVV